MTIPRVHLVLALAFVNGGSVSAARVLLALYALELGAKPLMVGLLAATFSALPMLLAVPAGRLADRFGARWLLILGSVGSALGLLLTYFFPSLTVAFIAAALAGLSTVIYNVLLQNLMGLLSAPEDRARNFSNYSLSKAFADLGGPLFAGFSIEHAGYVTACLYLALVNLVPILVLALRSGALRGRPQHEVHPGGNLRSLLAVPGVGRVLASSSLLNTGQDLYQFYMPVYMHGIGLSPSAIGMVLAMNSTAAFVVRLVLPRLVSKYGEERLLTYAFWVGAVSLVLVPLFTAAPMLGLISFIFGLGMGCAGPIVTMLMFTSSPQGRSGEALGLKVTVNHLTKVISPVIFGSIGSGLGLLAMFWINAAMLGTGGWLSRDKTRTAENEALTDQKV